MLSRASQMRIEPSRLNQFTGRYFERIRYSCDWRGLMRVNVLSALIRSVSKLILQCCVGCAQIPKTPAYSLISSEPVSCSGPGVTNVKDPSPFAVHPAGSNPPTRAQDPRFALFG